LEKGFLQPIQFQPSWSIFGDMEIRKSPLIFFLLICQIRIAIWNLDATAANYWVFMR